MSRAIRKFTDDQYRKYTMARIRARTRTDPGSGCWIWISRISADGYGRIDYRSISRGAHRVSYEIFVGPIPDGLQVDHLCRVRNCVNPKHLEAVTPRENVLRSESFAAKQAKRTHCPKGHPYSPENTSWEGRRGRARKCRECKRAADARRRAARGVATTQQVVRTHCLKGHLYSPENTMICGGRRRCRACHCARNRRYRAARSAK